MPSLPKRATTPSGGAAVCGGARTRTVSLLTLTEPLAPGDWVVIHSGFAVARLNAEEAHWAIALRTTSPTIPEGLL